MTIQVQLRVDIVIYSNKKKSFETYLATHFMKCASYLLFCSIILTFVFKNTTVKPLGRK